MVGKDEHIYVIEDDVPMPEVHDWKAMKIRQSVVTNYPVAHVWSMSASRYKPPLPHRFMQKKLSEKEKEEYIKKHNKYSMDDDLYRTWRKE